MSSPAADATVTDDTLLGGRVKLRQPAAGYRAGIDAVFLAAAVPARAGERVLDLGLGTGAAALCLACRVPGVRVTGLERDASYAALARGNARANGWADRIAVTEGDVAAPPDLGLFDHVLTNPPFIEDGQGTRARDPSRASAHSADVPLAVWLSLAGRCLKPGGTLSVVFPARREADLLAALPPGAVTLLPLVPRAGRAPKRLLLQLRSGRAAIVTRLPGLVLHGEVPGFTAAAECILREGRALSLDGPGPAA